MKKYILFDLDGTLTDPQEGIVNSVKYSLEKLGITKYDENSLPSFIGAPLSQAYTEYFGFTEEKAKEAIRLFREYYTPKGIFENHVYPGVKNMLSKLYSKEYTLAVATLKPTPTSVRVLEHFGLNKYFTFICGSDLQRTDEVKADIIKNAAALLNIKDNSLAVMVGDRKHDILGAAANGLDCIGVLYGHGSREELEKAGAHMFAHNAEDVYDIIESI
ncbi:MAG: HAD hydrolase-like protein [Clostridia bacterium]|nr:HAD hydrolase-like protein [Clostridia bacterium]